MSTSLQVIPVAFMPGFGQMECSEAAAPAASSTPAEIVKLKILTALLQGMMHNTCSTDVMYLAVASARNRCLGMGVSEADFNFVISVVVREYGKQRAANPLSRMFA